jgi:hypothetical protein
MKDALDTQTTDLFPSAKRGRGRPVTGAAQSNADRQRAYRQRLKSGQVVKLPTVTEMLKTPGHTYDETYRDEIELLRQALDLVVAHRNELIQELRQVKQENEQLKRNVTENPGQGRKTEIDRLRADNEKLQTLLDIHARSDYKQRALREEAELKVQRLELELLMPKKKRNVTKKQDG